MPKPKPISAGVLLYRTVDGTLEVLLVHPSGPYNRKAPWSIPKGLTEDGEDTESAARREAFEETGVEVGTLVSLGSIDYTKSRKTVVAYAGEAAEGVAPRCASWEVDCAEFVTIDRARELLHPEQRPFLDRLLALVADSGAGERSK